VSKLELVVLTVGVLLVAIGAGFVFWPAGLIVAGGLLIVLAWPEKGGDGA
jgi:hypothetical protein